MGFDRTQQGIVHTKANEWSRFSDLRCESGSLRDRTGHFDWRPRRSQLSPYGHAEIRRHHNWRQKGDVHERYGDAQAALARFLRVKKYSLPQLAPNDTEILFNRLAAEWRRETMLLSSMNKKLMHPAYLRIIGLGPNALPYILAALKREPTYWFRALAAIAGEDPVPANASFAEAVQAWIDWGRQRRLV